jgi:zinc protease
VQAVKALIVLLALCLPAWASPPPDVEDLTLPCGVRLISRTVEGGSIEGLSIFILGGSRALTPGTQGLEAFAIESALMGSSRYPGPSWRTIQDSTQARWSGVYSYDFSACRLTCLSSDLPLLVTAFTDCLQNPEMDSSAVTQVRERMLQDLLRERYDPDSRVWLVANAGMMPGHPYSLRPDGVPETVSGFDGQAAAVFLEDRMQAGNILVTHVGPTPTAELAVLLDRVFSTLPPGRDEYLPPPAYPLSSDTLIVEHAGVQTAYAVAKFAAPPPGHPDYPLFNAAMSVVSDELWQVLRTDSAFTYATYSGASLALRPWGYLYVSSSVPGRACPAMAEVLRSVARGEADPVEVAGTIATSETAHSMQMSSCGGQAYMIGLYEIVSGSWRNAWDYNDIAGNCTPAELGDVLERWIGPCAWGVIADTSAVDGDLLEPWPLEQP